MNSEAQQRAVARTRERRLDLSSSQQGVVEQTAVVARPAEFSRPWAMANGSLEAIKWLGILLMTADHINKYLYRETLPAVFEVGRIVMPLFGFVLAYNLARPGALAAGVHGRMATRLILMGSVATPVCVILNGTFGLINPWWPLNILFTLMLVVALTALIERGGATCYLMAISLFLVGGAFVEYLWMGVLCCLGAWAFCRNASPSRLLLWVIGTLSLTVVNGNAEAVAAIPIVLWLGQVSFRLRRGTWVFYGFYPLHLLVLLVILWQWFRA